MADETNISWADMTFNPVLGCARVSPACDGCYAAHMMETRFGRVKWGGPGAGAGTRVRTSKGNWRKPLAWDRAAAETGTRPFVFCASLADVFDNQWEDEWRRDLFDLMRATPNLIWLLLTKRPQMIVNLFRDCHSIKGGAEYMAQLWPRNAAIGTSVEDQIRFDGNVPALRKAKRLLNPAFAFLSCEPLLGNLVGSLHEIDWVITGGETDQGEHEARPTHPQWFRDVRDQCAAAGIPYHHKQNGEWVPAGHASISDATKNYQVDRSLGCLMVKVGKKSSGRDIDGVEHNEFPSIRKMA